MICHYASINVKSTNLSNQLRTDISNLKSTYSHSNKLSLSTTKYDDMLHKLQRKIGINITKNEKEHYVITKQPKTNYLTNNTCVLLTKVINNIKSDITVVNLVLDSRNIT